MKLTTDVIRQYLIAVGNKVHDVENLTHEELGSFCNELQHKTGVLYADVAMAMDRVARLPEFVIAHIESVIGVTPPSEVVASVAAPVVEDPIAVAPVTVAPVTVAPVTVAPVTVAPVVLEPVEEEQSKEPSDEAPKEFTE